MGKCEDGQSTGRPHAQGTLGRKEGNIKFVALAKRKVAETVNSTLAAEIQSLANGVGDLVWFMVVFMELVKPHFHVREWRKYVARRGYKAFTKVDGGCPGTG